MENYLKIHVDTDMFGKIIRWHSVPEGEYLLPVEEYERFADCNGSLYIVKDKNIIYDESLEQIV